MLENYSFFKYGWLIENVNASGCKLLKQKSKLVFPEKIDADLASRYFQFVELAWFQNLLDKYKLMNKIKLFYLFFGQVKD